MHHFPTIVWLGTLLPPSASIHFCHICAYYHCHYDICGITCENYSIKSTISRYIKTLLILDNVSKYNFQTFGDYCTAININIEHVVICVHVPPYDNNYMSKSP